MSLSLLYNIEIDTPFPTTLLLSKNLLKYELYEIIAIDILYIQLVCLIFPYFLFALFKATEEKFKVENNSGA